VELGPVVGSDRRRPATWDRIAEPGWGRGPPLVAPEHQAGDDQHQGGHDDDHRAHHDQQRHVGSLVDERKPYFQSRNQGYRSGRLVLEENVGPPVM
jgi:hypothetical protein